MVSVRVRYYVSAVVIAVGLCAAATANATTTQRVFHALPCKAANSNGILSSIYQWYNASSLGNTSIVCPVTSDSTVAIPATSPLTASVTVNGYDNAIGASSVRLCRQPASGGTPQCATTSASSTASGSWSLTAPLPSGLSVGDYVYLEVSLGPVMGGSYCTFWGYTLTNQ